ncbi:hypothetical protein GCM10011501_01900 [Thalassotalea profundi]|uniref:HTH marR-type domain-containing protein n=1 Tax=Thalassotalea profundi TaxID=2036687 RepID=A0ABQ3IEA7_9GAMM|nr:hypothetical protein GCM10011501_01900 [Thalassotalea profundi]
MYALLVISDKPITANELASTLNISRGNVSMGIKALQSRKLVQVTGDKKEYYKAIGSVIDMANIVFEERRKREVDPTLTLLRNLLLDTHETDSEKYAQQRMQVYTTY